MERQQPDRSDAARIAKEVERLVRETPPEVVERMHQRLEERRRSSEKGIGDDIMHKRAG